MKSFLLENKTIDFDEVTLEERPSNRVVDPALDQQLKSDWKRILKESHKNGISAWDSTSYRLNDYHISDNGVLHLEVAEIPFHIRHPLGKLKKAGTRNLPDHMMHRGLTVGAVIKTTDDYFIFGIRSGTSLSRTKKTIIGGMCIKDEIILSDGADLKKNIIVELEEEAGILPEHIRKISIEGIIQASTSERLVVTYVPLSISKREVERNFSKRTDDEIAELEFIHRNVVIDHIAHLERWRIHLGLIVERLLATQ